MTRQAAIRPHRHPARPVRVGAGRRGQDGRQRGSLHSGRPDFRPGRDAHVCFRAGDRDTAGVHVSRRRIQPYLDVHLLQPPLRVALQLGSKRSEHLRSRLEQQDPGFGRRHRLVLPRQRLVGELGDLAHHLHSGGSGSYHHESQVRGSFSRGGGQLGHLEGAKDTAPKLTCVLQRFQAGREQRPFVMPEVGVRAAGCDHQAVVPQHQLPAVRGQGMHDPVVQVQALDVGQHHPHIGLLPEHTAQRRRDEAFGQDPRRDLIEQRLEQVVIGPVHDGDVDIRAGQGPRRPDSAEPAADDNHPVRSLAHKDSISVQGPKC